MGAGEKVDGSSLLSYSLFKNIYFHFICMNILPAGMSVHHQSPGTGAIDGCEPCARNLPQTSKRAASVFDC